MLAIREDTPERLVIGTSAWHERVGLFFFGLGLLAFGIAMLTAGGELEFVWDFEIFVNLGQHILPLPFAGVLILFMQKRLVLLKTEQQVYFKEGLNLEKQWRFDLVMQIEVLHDNQPQALFRIVLKDGRKIPVTRGKGPEFDTLVAKVTAALSVDCVEVQLAPKN